MSDLEIFGPIILGTNVEDAVTTTLQTWLPDYLGWISRTIGQAWNWLPVPGSYVVANDEDHWPEDQLPAIVIASDGTLGTPSRSSGMYRAMWQIDATVFVSASDRTSTERLAKYYGGAIRAVLAEKGALGGFAAGTKWLGEKYNSRMADRDQRSLGKCCNTFNVDVRDVVQTYGGPLVPDDPSGAPANWPTATNVTTTLSPESP